MLYLCLVSLGCCLSMLSLSCDYQFGEVQWK
uniref:Uncharacterized protein n=1 Tax=Arundo donax TaxID=35708 RepID=A0A0A9FDN5_ARUDO